VEATRADAEKDGVIVPETLEEYCIKSTPKPIEDPADMLDLDEDYYDYGDESGKSTNSLTVMRHSTGFWVWN
jgi:ubiquitin-conjugating enzyme E2 R